MAFFYTIFINLDYRCLCCRVQELYESGISQQVESNNKGKIVAINIETGEFAIADNVLPATKQLLKSLFSQNNK